MKILCIIINSTRIKPWLNIKKVFSFLIKQVSGAISASMFVGKSDGKLRDYYRIGKILGTGKLRNSIQTNEVGSI